LSRKRSAVKPAPGRSNSVRIIAGHWRGRRVHFPDAQGLRPTADRVRETLFNWLQGKVEAEDCLDLFAGSGACGFEALSRGARAVVFVDAAMQVTRNIQQELDRLKADPAKAQVVTATAQQWLAQAAQKPQCYGVVFLDPPFADDLLVSSCAALESSGVLKPCAWVYLESGAPLPALETHAGFPANWQLHRHGRAGLVYYGLYERSA
jgi:16S rRNA (guanine966-N2)-methyltransferase